jgi:mono/diheme cytochrome c family protein
MKRLASAAAIALLPSMASAQDQALLERGRDIAAESCARCHAVGESDASTLPAAPPFRELGQRYPVSDLEEALAEGIVTAHPDMPQFAFPPEDVAAIIAYLETIQQP